MSFIAVFLIIAGLLFAAAFFTRRRFGTLGLALAAGAMLSTLWVGDLTPIIADAGIVIIKPPLETIVSTSLVLLPAILLLFSGPVYKSTMQRVIGSAAFAVLAVTLLLDPLGTGVVIEDVGKDVYEFFVNNRVVIITAGLALAVFDLLVAKTPKLAKDHK